MLRQLRHELAQACAVLVQWWRLALTHPARIVPAVYLAGWVAGTIALRLPVSAAPGAHHDWWEASFTSMSALCITGLAVVDTASTWSLTGQVVILLLIQLGGFGIMTLASMVLFSLRGGATHTAAVIAQTEIPRDHTEIEHIPRRILALSLSCEAALATLLAGRFLTLGYTPASAAYHGIFHAVSAFNNAGFALYPDNLVGFNADPWVMVPVCAGVIAGGLGFPIYLEVIDRLRRRRRMWSVHAHLTLTGTLVLLAVGYLAFVVFEWSNPATLGAQSWSGKLLGALGGTVFPRTAGFNSVDYGAVTGPTLLVTDGLMMVGGGSAGTAGGLKITTAAVLLMTVITEVAGEKSTVVARRRLSSAVIRRALAVTVLATGVVFSAVLIMSSVEPYDLDALTFEAISAFATVGLSTGVTADLSHASWGALMTLMYLGRVGPVSAVAALAMHTRLRRFEFPPEDPLVG